MFKSLILICWTYKSALSQFRFQKKWLEEYGGIAKKEWRVEQEFEVDSVYSLTSGILSCWLLHIYVFTYWALLQVFHISVLLCLHCCPSRKVSSECFNTKWKKPREFWSFKNVLVFIETTLSNCIMSYMYISSLS